MALLSLTFVFLPYSIDHRYPVAADILSPCAINPTVPKRVVSASIARQTVGLWHVGVLFAPKKEERW